MGLKVKLVNQCRKPKGKFGRFIAKGMNKGHSEMALWGISHISINPKDIILDIGCGGGMNVFNFAKIAQEGKVYGIDYSETSVEVSKKINRIFIESGIVEIKHASVSKLPFSKNTFDTITGFETYYFWPDLINDLKGIFDVLKPKGILLLVNEAYKCKNEKLRKRNEEWSKIGNFTINTPQEFQDFLQEAGFSEIKVITDDNKGFILVIGKKIL